MEGGWLGNSTERRGFPFPGFKQNILELDLWQEWVLTKWFAGKQAAVSDYSFTGNFFHRQCEEVDCEEMINRVNSVTIKKCSSV